VKNFFNNFGLVGFSCRLYFTVGIIVFSAEVGVNELRVLLSRCT